MTLILDGKKIRDERAQGLKEVVLSLPKTPVLAIIQVGDNERSNAYIEQKKKFGVKIGAEVVHIKLPENCSEIDVLAKIQELNSDQNVNGIIIQLPLPASLNQLKLIDAIRPVKDVDGLTSENVKKLVIGDRSGYVPATARGVLTLLDYYKVSLEGMKAVVVGRSLIVGKPVTLELLNRNATVTVCHKHTNNLAQITSQADLVIVGIGQPEFMKSNYFKPGAMVVDVGINIKTGEKLGEEIPGKNLVGDVDFNKVKDVAGAISPVPGGVGPMTVLSLFENVVEASKKQIIS